MKDLLAVCTLAVFYGMRFIGAGLAVSYLRRALLEFAQRRSALRVAGAVVVFSLCLAGLVGVVAIASSPISAFYKGSTVVEIASVIAKGVFACCILYIGIYFRFSNTFLLRDDSESTSRTRFDARFFAAIVYVLLAGTVYLQSGWIGPR